MTISEEDYQAYVVRHAQLLDLIHEADNEPRAPTAYDADYLGWKDELEEIASSWRERNNALRRLRLRQTIEESQFFEALDGMWQPHRVDECMNDLIDRIEDLFDNQ